jgi:hypothetical protein
VEKTHFLASAEGGTSQNRERKRACEEHPRPVEHSGREKSEHQKNASEKGYILSVKYRERDK